MATAEVNEIISNHTIKNKGFRGYLVSAAVDIGTSTSCFAFSFKSSPENISLSTSGQSGTQSYKVPTTILTEEGADGKFLEFGEAAEKTYRDMVADGNSTKCNLYTDFKMILYRTENVSTTGTMAESKINTKRPLMDLYVMTLKYIKKEFEFQMGTSGHSTIHPWEVRWVLCVPATWTDSAKAFLREAAFRAKLIGYLESSQLLIVLEATAAALYCTRRETRFSALHLESDESMKVGTRYLVVDAGAGTVDYTAQEILEDMRTKEIAIAGGGDWGGRHIDQRFLNLIKEVLGEDRVTQFIKRYPQQWYDFETEFEVAKSKVVDICSSLSVKLPGVMDRFLQTTEKKWVADIVNENTHQHQVSEKDGLLVVSAEKVQQLFISTLEQITKKTEEMLQDHDLTGLDMIYLVGGFASSRPLQTIMQDRLRKYRMSIPLDARAAVVQGAVMYGLNPRSITRIAKKTYGVGTNSEFNPNQHDDDHRSIVGRQSFCTNLFLPFVQKGNMLEPGTEGEMIASPLSPGANCIIVDFYCIDRTIKPSETLYIDSEGMEKVGTIALHMPESEESTNHEVLLQFSFEDEIRVIAVDTTSNTSKEVSLNFDYDTRK